MLINRYRAAFLAACVLAHAVDASAQPARRPVEQFAPLLLAALDAPDGAAHGVLTGNMAVAISRQYGTSAPIEIDVATIVRYAQPGCARLRVDVSQQGVKFAATAAPQRQEIRFELNYCSDGLPPRSQAARRGQ
jgi:hypothetical protein